jgi:hypothetical protein
MTAEVIVQKELFSSPNEIQQKRAFFPKYFIVCPLPTRSTGADVKEYVKKYNQFCLKIVGANGIPGGKIARDILTLFTTEAVYTKKTANDRPLRLYYDSINKFVKSIGLDRSNYNNKVLETVDKFSHCNIFFELDDRKPYAKEQLDEFNFSETLKKEIPSKGVLRLRSLVNIPFFSSYNKLDIIGEGYKSGKACAIEIVLSDDFKKLAQEYGVPIDFTVYSNMRSTLEKDLYVWLIYKNKQLIKQEGIFISRKNLVEQFGQDDENEHEESDRKKYQRIIEAVKRIRKEYCPGLNYEIIKNDRRYDKGIVLHDSKLTIKEVDKKYVPLLAI